MEDFISIAMYFFFFWGGFWVDKSNNLQIRRLFIFLTYLFLCFGYMTGGDWVGYEADYYNPDLEEIKILSEPGYIFLITKIRLVIEDFFLALGLSILNQSPILSRSLPTATLISFESLFRKFSSHWILCLSIAMPVFSLFVLIDNPLRFMIAMSFINIGVVWFLQKKWLLCSIFFIGSVFFHYTTAVSIPLLFFYNLRYKICAFNERIVFISYIVFCLIIAATSIVSSLFEKSGNLLQLIGQRSYEVYAIGSNNSLFSIGSLISAFFASYMILSKRDIINGSSQYGQIIYSFSILYIFLSRLLMIVPTGFRLAIPFAVFSVLSWSILLKKDRIKVIYIVLTSLILFKTLYNSFSYIPYSNSLYYIMTEHKSSNERENYNLKAYKDRLGKEFNKGE